MNAFTSSDHTTYPFATTNKVDFNNLMDVYLDATLNPILSSSDFKQEGWRIGPTIPDDASSPLEFKGVVYNEMKGQMSDASYLYHIRFQDHIFPSINNSGGDPAVIPNLTVEQLRKFHDEHYHPSNAKIITYGDFPLQEHLDAINKKLEGFERIKADQDIKDPIELKENVEVTEKGPVDPLIERSEQFKTSVSWIMNETPDVHETFALRILSNLLLDGYGSPFYQGLIDTKLGTDFSPNTGYDTSARKAIFSVGLCRVSEENLPKVGEAINNILANVKASGFDGKKVDGILHQLELALKHKTANFGLNMIHSVNGSWFNGADPFKALSWEEIVTEFKARYQDNKAGYLEGLIDKYLLGKPTFKFTMVPDEGYEQSLAAGEQVLLQKKIADLKLGDKTAEILTQQEAELREAQGKANSQPLDCLPSVHVKDIPRTKEGKELTHSKVGRNTSVQWRTAPTNGLTYFRAINVFENLPEHLRMYLPLFNDAIFRLGTKTKSMEQIEDEIKQYTGGISTGVFVTSNHSDLSKAEEGLSWSGYCLDRNVPKMYELLRTVLTETNFDQPTKLGTLIQGTAGGLVNALAESGHSYARTFAAAHLTPAAKIGEVTGGMTQVRMLSRMAADEFYGEAIMRLKEIAKFAGSNAALRTAITCGSDSVSSNEKHLKDFVSSLLHTPAPISDLAGFEFEKDTRKTFFPLPFQVSYSALTLKTVPYTHVDGAALQILAQLLTHKHLHHEIREKGGAYGGGAFLQAIGGIFGFYSYRDPNIPNTLNIMKNAGKFAIENQWTAEALEGAKLSVFQGIDAPVSVSEEGMINFLHGISDEMRQVRRELLLDVTVEDVRRVAEKYLVDIDEERSAVAVLGEKKEWVDEKWAVLDLSTEEKEMPDMEELLDDGKVTL